MPTIEPLKTILALAQDPGGAEALEPVLIHLHARDDVTLHVLARKHASSIFSRAGLTVETCDFDGWDFEQWQSFAEDWLSRYLPDQLLTATSNSGLLERAFIRAAKRSGIKTLTVIDFWTNYTKRFLLVGESQLINDILPHEIAVIDEFSASEMQAVGFPKDFIHVTGQPAFDKFVAWTKKDQAKIVGQQLRHELRLTDNVRLLVFFSQYISDMYPVGTPGYRGYTEFDVLSDLIKTISDVCSPIFLAIKTHPKESPNKFEAQLKDAPSNVRLISGANSDALIMAADIIVGMTSTAMVKGFLAGRNIISYQPGLCVRDEMILSRMGVIHTLQKKQQLKEAINRLLTEPPMITKQDIPDTWLSGRAVDRILERFGLSKEA